MMNVIVKCVEQYLSLKMMFMNISRSFTRESNVKCVNTNHLENLALMNTPELYVKKTNKHAKLVEENPIQC